MDSSRRDLLNDRAEYRSIFKNDQNTYYTRFSFTPITGIELPETGVSFKMCFEDRIFYPSILSFRRQAETSNIGSRHKALYIDIYHLKDGIVCADVCSFHFVILTV